MLRWRHGKMKGAFSWNPGCSTISIFIKTSHPLWSGLCNMLYYVCVCLCGGERERESEGKERETEAEGETDKQSESKGVAQSDKLNPMNEQSGKKWLIHGYVPCISVCPPVQRAVRLQPCSQRREKHLSDQSLDKRPQRGDAQEESRSQGVGLSLSGVAFGVRDPVKLSSQPYWFRDGRQVRQRNGTRGEKKSHLK